MVPDPAVAAWFAAGQPPVEVECDKRGVCVRCGSSDRPCVDADRVVSAKFSGWDRFRPSGRTSFLCVACTWAHREPGLRALPLLVRVDEFRRLDPGSLAEVLAVPVGPGSAVTVPDGKRKHLLPEASWGMVTTDRGSALWTASDIALVPVLRALLDAGIPVARLPDRDPPLRAFAAVPADRISELLGAWARLGPWRDELVKLQCGLAATRGVAQ